MLWLPALLLGGVAVALGGAHGILREAWFAEDIDIPQYLVCHLPLRYHVYCDTGVLLLLHGRFSEVSIIPHIYTRIGVCFAFGGITRYSGEDKTPEDRIFIRLSAHQCISVLIQYLFYCCGPAEYALLL